MAYKLGFAPEYSEHYFLCYNESDAKTVEELARSLHDEGMRFWYNDDPITQREWEENTARGMKGCKAMLVFIGKGFFDKPFTDIIVYGKAAEYFGIKLLPVLLERPQGAVPQKLDDFWNELCAGGWLYLSSADTAKLKAQAIDKSCAERHARAPKYKAEEAGEVLLNEHAVRIEDEAPESAEKARQAADEMRQAFEEKQVRGAEVAAAVEEIDEQTEQKLRSESKSGLITVLAVIIGVLIIVVALVIAYSFYAKAEAEAARAAAAALAGFVAGII